MDESDLLERGRLGDLTELRRLAGAGSPDARDVLDELTDDAG